jgi:hypothetical protein
MHATSRLRARLWGILFIVVVAGAVGLLVAGYGVVVGFGALAGLILGFVAGLVGTMWVGRGAGRSVSFASMEWSSGSDWSSDQPSAELMADMRELSEISSMDLGAIEAVTPVLVTADGQGLTVQLVTVERREAGLAMTVEVRPKPGVFPPSSMARVSVTDDVGTPYRATAQGQGGSPSMTRYQVSVIPAPPRAAGRLGVVFERFADPFPTGGHTTIGPWTFSVPLES